MTAFFLVHNYFSTCSDVIVLVRAHADALNQPAALLATQHVASLLLGAPGPEEIKVSSHVQNCGLNESL